MTWPQSGGGGEAGGHEAALWQRRRQQGEGRAAARSLPGGWTGRLDPILPDFTDGAPDLAGQVEGLGVALQDVLLDRGQADLPQWGLANHADQVAGGIVKVHQEASSPDRVEPFGQERGVLLARLGGPPACPAATVFGIAPGGVAKGAGGGLLAPAQVAGRICRVKPQQRHGAVAIWGEGRNSAGVRRPASC